MTLKTFKLRPDGKYDLPFDMVAEHGGRICYIRGVPLHLMQELVEIVPGWRETLYISVGSQITGPKWLGELIYDALKLDIETLAFTPRIESGMMVYQNRRGEWHPIIPGAQAGSVIGLMQGYNDQGHVIVRAETIVPPGRAIRVTYQAFGSTEDHIVFNGPEIQGESGPEGDEDE